MIDKIQIVHKDFRESLESMPLESVGRIFLALFRYANDENPNDILEGDTTALCQFLTMKGHIERNEQNRKKWANNGSRGGAPEGNKNASKNKDKQPNSSKNNQKQTPNPNPNPIPIPFNNTIVEEIVRYLNEKTGKHFQAKGKTVEYINGRLKDGYTVDDFKKVIDKKVRKWKSDPKMVEFLRPSTLFAPSHFDEYLNEPDISPVKPNQFNNCIRRDYDMDELERQLVKN